MTTFKDTLNEYGKKRTPCLFMIDYAMQNPLVFPLRDINPKELLYNFKGKSNTPDVLQSENKHKILINKKQVSYEQYCHAFSYIQSEFRKGNTYLVNLTAQTPVIFSESLQNIFFKASAKYKLWFQNKFVFFSPEQFVIIKDNTIRTFPMKGTARASVEDSEKKMLVNEKELAEHVTVVDLLRNDIGMVAANVRVERFRYIDRIVTPTETLLQVSSEITGTLPVYWQENLGDIVATMLPAGSVTGAPKKKTMEIIAHAEQYDRGYYTGVAGIFDGSTLDSCVMIRFIEKQADSGYVYKSGGGITIYSDCESEYQELNDKIYVPNS